MTPPLEIAVITPDTLVYMGLRSVVRDMSGCRVTRFTSFGEYAACRRESFDLTITDADIFAAHAHHFVPRRGKTAVIASAAQSERGITVISRNGDESDVIETLENALSGLRSDEGQLAQLSPREIDVLKQVAIGLTNKEIADRLGISVNTVLTHRKNITAKLGIRSVSGLSVYAMMNGYISQQAR